MRGAASTHGRRGARHARADEGRCEEARQAQRGVVFAHRATACLLVRSLHPPCRTGACNGWRRRRWTQQWR
eukprot:201137-Chlamydomonas_euryale.AAC.1